MSVPEFDESERDHATGPTGAGRPDLLRTMWTSPRTTVRWVLDHGDGGLWRGLLVAALATPVLPLVLPAFFLVPKAAETGFLASILTNAGLVIAGILVVGIGSLVGIGRVLGSRRPVRDTLKVVGWGLLPVAAALPFSLLGVACAMWAPSPLVYVCELIVIACAAWAFILLAFALAELHEVSVARGLAILMITVTITWLLAVAAAFALMRRSGL